MYLFSFLSVHYAVLLFTFFFYLNFRLLVFRFNEMLAKIFIHKTWWCIPFRKLKEKKLVIVEIRIRRTQELLAGCTRWILQNTNPENLRSRQWIKIINLDLNDWKIRVLSTSGNYDLINVHYFTEKNCY